MATKKKTTKKKVAPKKIVDETADVMARIQKAQDDSRAAIIKKSAKDWKKR